MRKIWLILFFPFGLKAQNKYSSLLDSFMQAEVIVHHFNGNVLVAESGNIIYQKSFGYRNYDTKELLDNNSIFELASISKQFTAMGIIILRDMGKLQLSDSLRKFFPELPYDNITIQQLLTHTSGMPDYMDVIARKWNHKIIAYNNDVIHFLATENIPANFKPGQHWEYSNTAYEMLASIIEKVSGVSFKHFMQRYIFEPLDMQHSQVYARRSTKEIIPNYAFGFIYADSLRKYILPDRLPSYDYVIYLDGIEGDGCVNSTTGDLLKWDRALKNHLLLNEASQNEMLSPQSLMDTPSKSYYGYGEMLGENELGNYITHTGHWPGYSNVLTRYKEKDITIIILSNNSSPTSLLPGALAYIVSNRQVVLPSMHSSKPIAAELLDKFFGKYSIPNGPTSTIIELKKIDGKLFLHYENAETAMELKSESGTKFYNDHGSGLQIEFEVSASGKVLKAFFISGGIKKEMKIIN